MSPAAHPVSLAQKRGPGESEGPTLSPLPEDHGSATSPLPRLVLSVALALGPSKNNGASSRTVQLQTQLWTVSRLRLFFHLLSVNAFKKGFW